MAKKILFVEDERRMQETLGTKLREEGYEVVSAYDGESGLEMIEKEKPDLILLDLILPKKDGFEVLEELRKKPGLSAIPVVVLTNLESSKDVERCLALGIRSYLAKANYTLEEVAKKIKQVLS